MCHAPADGQLPRRVRYHVPSNARHANADCILNVAILASLAVRDAMSDFRARYHAVGTRLAHPRSAVGPRSRRQARDNWLKHFAAPDQTVRRYRLARHRQSVAGKHPAGDRHDAHRTSQHVAR
jgi:hypothetical protein